MTTLIPGKKSRVSDLILHLDGAQFAVDAVLQSLAAVAGAAAVDPGVDEVPAGRHVGVPADPPASRHLLCARTAVSAAGQSAGERRGWGGGGKGGRSELYTGCPKSFLTPLFYLFSLDIAFGHSRMDLIFC